MKTKIQTRKGQIGLSKIMIAMVLVALFVVSINLILNDFTNQRSDITLTQDTQDRLASFNETLDEIGQNTADIQNRSEGTQASQDVDVGLNLESATSALKLVYNSFDFASNMVNTLAVKLGVPAVFPWVLIMIMIITISFIFLAAVFKIRL